MAQQQENSRRRKVTHRQIEPKKEPQKKQYRVARKRPEKPESKLKIIPLGGLTEIGKNMTVFEYGNDMIIIVIKELHASFMVLGSFLHKASLTGMAYLTEYPKSP